MNHGKVIKELSLAYAMELESVQNCTAASVNRGGEEDHRREFIGFLKEYEKR